MVDHAEEDAFSRNVRRRVDEGLEEDVSLELTARLELTLGGKSLSQLLSDLFIELRREESFELYSWKAFF